VITVHDLIHLHDEAEHSPLKKLYYDKFVKPAIIKAGRVFTVSETSAHQIREWLSQGNIRVINTSCGVSPEFLSTGAKDSRAEGAFLYVGSIKPHKNVDILFKALSVNSSFKLVLVTSDISAAQQLVVEYNVQDQVTILSRLSDSELSALYRAAQALLMPSTLEGFGLPAAEAIACGTPVLHWDGCESVKEIVGEYGSCLPSATDVDQWSEAMQSIYSGIKKSVNPSAAWRNTYSWDSVGKIVNQELTTLLAESALS
jgi:glycosyltransferase involved in cell wall biosynthesis